MASQSSGTQKSGSADRYVYDKIINPEPQFRLLELLPANQPHEPIVCHLRTYRLGKNKGCYEALSYVWGDERDKFDIQVGEKRHSVTHNLNTALRHLRDKKHQRTMWIDALCIDQENEKEKEAQLAIMPKIYKGAQRVVVWLGPAANNSDLAMAFIKGKGAKDAKDNTSQKDQKGAQGEKDKKAKTSDKNEEIREHITKESENRLRRALVAIMEREYWTRVWVVQEIFKATKIELVLGESSTSWEDATVVINELLNSREAPFTSGGKLLQRTNMSNETWAMPTSQLMTLGHLAGYRRTKKDERGPDWLMNMFVQLRRFQSTKQNDKIFSLVGLRNPTLFKKSESSENPDIPDLSTFKYSWSFREVSLRLFKNFIFTQRERGTPDSKKPAVGSMNILCASQPDPRPEPENNFPTWLPDFSRDNGMEPWPIFETQICDFLKSGAKIQDGGILTLQACRLGKIEHLTDKDDDYLADDCFGLLTRLSTFLQIAHRNKVCRSKCWKPILLGQSDSQFMFDYASKRPKLEKLLDDLRNDLRAALSKRTTRAAPAEPSTKEATPSDTVTPTHDEIVARSFFDLFRRRSYLRRFAVIQLQLPSESPKAPAMVPAATKSGDFLYLVGDCDRPVILRKDGDNFRFVGPCCIDLDLYDISEGKLNNKTKPKLWVTKMMKDKAEIHLQ